MFTPEQKQTIASVFAGKNLNPCPSCGHTNTWQVGEGLVLFPFSVSNNQGIYVPGNNSYPCVPIVCSFCGNTMFHNALTLGLGELLGLLPPRVITPAPMPVLPAGRK